MFDFHKEVVINSADKFKKLTNGTIQIDSMNYKPEYMGQLFMTEPVEGTNATIKLTPAASWKSGENYEIRIELGLDKDYRGDYASVLYYFRKPVVVSLNDTSVDNIAKAFELAIPKEYKFLTVTKDASAVTLTAADSYIKVRKVEVVDYQGEEVAEPVVVAGYNVEGVAANGVVVTKNTVEFGTYNYLIQNLRLPTYENLRFTSPAAVEMPVYGGKYYQFSFIYTVPRHIGGLSVVGQVNHSSTTHTFYVIDSLMTTFVSMFATEKKTGVLPGEISEPLQAPELVVATDSNRAAPIEGFAEVEGTSGAGAASN